MRMGGLIVVGALALATAGCAGTRQEAKETAITAGHETASYTTDRWITSKIKTDFAFDRDIKATSINVDTAGGVVTLTGLVPSRFVAQKAVQSALNTSGVKEVRSNLRFPTGGINQARVFRPGQPVRF